MINKKKHLLAFTESYPPANLTSSGWLRVDPNVSKLRKTETCGGVAPRFSMILEDVTKPKGGDSINRIEVLSKASYSRINKT